MEKIGGKTDKANILVRNYMIGSIVGGLVPFPLLDMALITAIQLKMLHSLAKLYDIEFSENLGKSVIAALLGGGVPLSLSSSVVRLTSLAKLVPIYGVATGIISITLFNGASTYAIGKVFIQHFESGGTFLNFDPQQVRDHYAQEFEQGKEIIRTNFAGIRP